MYNLYGENVSTVQEIYMAGVLEPQYRKWSVYSKVGIVVVLSSAATVQVDFEGEGCMSSSYVIRAGAMVH